MSLIYQFYLNFIKKFTIKKLNFIFLIIFFSPIFIFVVLLRPLIVVRFGIFDIARIGIISSAEHHLLHDLKKKKLNSIDIWFIDSNIYNKQLLIMLKRKFFIVSKISIFYKTLQLLAKYINLFSIHIITLYKGACRLDRSSCILKLTNKEIQEGEKYLKNFGIPTNAKIICLTLRDNLYLKKKFPSENFSYHNYRDVDVKNFIPAIKALLKKNFYVIRMGRESRKRLNIKNKKFIDYPFHSNRNDFMDIFFAYKCYFWICGNNGLDQVATTFRKPLIDLNIIPVSSLKITSKKTLLCLKIHKNYKNKKLSLSEIFNYGVEKSTRSDEFKKKKVKLSELNSKQIKDIVLEMLNFMRKSWKITNKKELKLINKFSKIYLKKSHLIDPKFKYKINAIYSPIFLKKNPWFLRN